VVIDSIFKINLKHKINVIFNERNTNSVFIFESLNNRQK